NINIFRDSNKIAVDTDEIDPTLPRITLAEMLDDLNIEDVEMSDKFVKGNLTESENRLFEEVVDVLHWQERASARALDTYGQARITLDCVICRSAFAAAFEAVREGQTHEELTSVITVLCTAIGIESYEVCSGVVALNLPIITYIIENQPAATPAAICGFLEQTAHNPNNNLCPFEDERFEWVVSKRDGRPLTVAVMTDFHIDPLYEAFGQADCDEPTCCRIGQRPATRHSTFDDEPVLNQTIVRDGRTVKLDLDMSPTLREMRTLAQSRSSISRQSEPAGYWGDFRNCDTPLWAFNDAIDRIVETHKDIDVVYYIGDTIDHFVWETTYELINDVNRYVIEKLRKSFGEGVNTTWLYEALASKWSYYLPSDAQNTFRERGEYSVLLRPGLRLYKAELSGESVHILAHIPPGVHDLTYTWTREYNRIIN
ncbi:Sphingomyelin phosphodiesterase, partial [Operophtera brumata]